MTSDPSDADAILSALDFDTNWLIEASNADPLQFLGREERLYAIMNKMQFVTSRFAHVHHDNKDLDREIAVMKAIRDSDPQWKDASR